ncbi:MAG: hypothetical protein H6561_03710 [Lewinellaceae bacterium]|nr:hypothetical protein [Saprospiraceae bacterium]MCB9268656.1 hypothetical protein [Lewinellaceae bacterium]HPQ98976.1 hypothetical protein [Saprospiraceae bacterium]
MKAKYIRLSLFGILISFIITACSSSRKSTMPVVFDPAGNWNYTVSNTPMGTITGTLNLMNDGVHWTAKMSSSLGVMPVENLEISERMIKARLTYDGSPIRLEGNFDTDQSLKGSILSDYGSFPLTATKAN